MSRNQLDHSHPSSSSSSVAYVAQATRPWSLGFDSNDASSNVPSSSSLPLPPTLPTLLPPTQPQPQPQSVSVTLSAPTSSMGTPMSTRLTSLATPSYGTVAAVTPTSTPTTPLTLTGRPFESSRLPVDDTDAEIRRSFFGLPVAHPVHPPSSSHHHPHQPHFPIGNVTTSSNMSTNAQLAAALTRNGWQSAVPTTLTSPSVPTLALPSSLSSSSSSSRSIPLVGAVPSSQQQQQQQSQNYAYAAAFAPLPQPLTLSSITNRVASTGSSGIRNDDIRVSGSGEGEALRRQRQTEAKAAADLVNSSHLFIVSPSLTTKHDMIL
jgi:hypothetical protein